MFQGWRNYAAIPLRIAFGVIFVAHGAQKLFGWFGGSGLESTASFLASHGLTPGPAWALFAGAAESRNRTRGEEGGLRPRSGMVAGAPSPCRRRLMKQASLRHRGGSMIDVRATADHIALTLRPWSAA